MLVLTRVKPSPNWGPELHSRSLPATQRHPSLWEASAKP
jgi:hypothetical protein